MSNGVYVARRVKSVKSDKSGFLKHGPLGTKMNPDYTDLN